jgi:hypothetical protein
MVHACSGSKTVRAKGGYRHGVANGMWSREEADGTKKEWQFKDGILKEIDQALKAI